jgi:hypothetical protein
VVGEEYSAPVHIYSFNLTAVYNFLSLFLQIVLIQNLFSVEKEAQLHRRLVLPREIRGRSDCIQHHILLQPLPPLPLLTPTTDDLAQPLSPNCSSLLCGPLPPTTVQSLSTVILPLQYLPAGLGTASTVSLQ